MEPAAASGSSFMVLSVSVVGILAISLLLLAYYLFLTRCRCDCGVAVAVASWAPGVVVVPVPAAGPARSGLEEAAIRRIPTFRFGERKEVAGECAVCLGEFAAGERLRLLPPCLHAFHIDCIDAWLHATATCPLCRASLDLDAAAHQTTIDVPNDIDGDGEECIGDEASSTSRRCLPDPNPMRRRRSLSMDSSVDKHFYLALQAVLQPQPGPAAEGAKEAGGGRRALRRSFFSFSHGQGRGGGSAIAILPISSHSP